MIKIYFLNWNGIFDKLILDENICSTDENAADLIMLWQDYIFGGKVCAQRWKGKKPVIVLQHGINAIKDYIKGGRQLIADHYLCWGDLDYRELTGYVARNNLNTKVYKVGSPVIERINRKIFTVCYAPDKASKKHLDENQDRLNFLLDLKRKYGFNLVVKLVASQVEEIYDNPDIFKLVSNQREKTHLEICKNAILNSDFVVSTGTFNLLAMAAGVKTFDMMDKNFKPDFLKEIDKTNNIYKTHLANYAGDYTNSKKNILNVLTSIIA